MTLGTNRKFSQESFFNEFASEDNGLQKDLRVINIASMVPKSYDYVECSYMGSDMTGVVFKTGGALGTIVATLALTYDGSSNLLTVTRT